VQYFDHTRRGFQQFSPKKVTVGQKLGKEDFDKHLRVVRRRMCQAGLRLAMVLNEAFAD
jgi:hypothetical protein